MKKHKHNPSGHAGHGGHSSHTGHSSPGHSCHSSHTGGGDMPASGHHCHGHGHGNDHEKARMILSIVFSVPLLILAMGRYAIAPTSPILFDYIEFLLATPVVLWAAWPFFRRGLFAGSTNMFTLISLGVIAAYAYSCVAVLWPDIFPAALIGEDGRTGLYFEAAAVIVTLVWIGQILESRSQGKTDQALRSLLDLTPRTAWRLTSDGQEEEVPLASIHIGDHVRIKPGENIPVDGVVLSGASLVDESMIRGESIPVARNVGDNVVAGTLNGNGSLVIKAQQVGEKTLLARIVRLAQHARSSRPSIQRLVDNVSRIFVPLVVIIAALSFAAFATFLSLSYAMVAAVSVLIIACPCALGLATPISISVGVGRGALLGILVRDAQTLERMESVDTIVMDKTGTLTLGKPEVQEVHSVKGFSDDDLLALAAAVERHSEHPLAGAIVTAAKERSLAVSESTMFQSFPGKGASAVLDGRVIRCGTQEFTAKGKKTEKFWASCQDKAGDWRDQGAGVIFVAVDDLAAGMIAVADPIRPMAKQVLADIVRKNISIMMLTGDNRVTARAVAGKLGIEQVEAEVLPQDKHRVIRDLQRSGHVVAMVGDGVNDAPALAQADVSIAMGKGSDAAIESAGMTLMHDDLNGIVQGHRLSLDVMRNIRQNLFFAFIYNIVGIMIASGVFYPIFHEMLNPMLAALAMTVSSLCVIFNALRLRYRGREHGSILAGKESA